jgi:acyl dehydratase
LFRDPPSVHGDAEAAESSLFAGPAADAKRPHRGMVTMRSEKSNQHGHVPQVRTAKLVPHRPPAVNL